MPNGRGEGIPGHPEFSKKCEEAVGEDWYEKIEKAREAARLGQKLRAGKPLVASWYRKGQGIPGNPEVSKKTGEAAGDELYEKIQTALAARRFGQRLREGKPIVSSPYRKFPKYA